MKNKKIFSVFVILKLILKLTLDIMRKLSINVNRFFVLQFGVHRFCLTWWPLVKVTVMLILCAHVFGEYDYFHRNFKDLFATYFL